MECKATRFDSFAHEWCLCLCTLLLTHCCLLQEHLQEVADEAVAERDKVRKDTSSRSGDMAATLNQQILAQKQEIALLKTENERLRSDAARARPAPAPCAECAKRHDNMAKRADNLTAKSNVGSTQSSFRSVSPGMQRPVRSCLQAQCPSRQLTELGYAGCF